MGGGGGAIPPPPPKQNFEAKVLNFAVLSFGPRILSFSFNFVPRILSLSFKFKF